MGRWQPAGLTEGFFPFSPPSTPPNLARKRALRKPLPMLPAIFGLSGLTLSDDERAFFRDCDPAAYILFGRNVESRTPLRALTTGFDSSPGMELLVNLLETSLIHVRVNLSGRDARVPQHFLDLT